MRLLLKTVVILCFSYLTIGFVAIPPLLHLAISQFAPNYLSVPLQIGAIQFNPITLKLTVDTVDAGGVVGFSQLSADLAWDSFFEQKLHLQSIEVQRLYGAAVLDRNGRTNLEAIFRSPPDKPKAQPNQDKNVRPPLIQIDSVIINDSNGHFRDNRIGATTGNTFDINIHSLNVSANNLGWPYMPAGKLKITAQLNPHTKIEASATLSYPELAVSGDIHLQNLSLKQAQPYLENTSYITIDKGQLSGKTHINWQQDSGLSVQADTKISDFQLSDRRSQIPIGAWSSLQLSNIDYSEKVSALNINDILLDSPSIKLAIDEHLNTNLAGLIKNESQPEAKQSPQTPLAITIGNVQLNNGTIDFTDDSFEPGFSAPISELKGQLSSINLTGQQPITLNFDGKVDRYSPVQINGVLNPTDVTDHTDINITFDDLELTTLTPYSGRFAGYKIEKGRMDLNLDYKIDKSSLVAKNQIVLEHLKLGDQVDSDEAVNMPVKLAIALLKDADGRIDIKLPVKGDLDDPEFEIGPAMRQAIVNRLSSVLVSPFDFLASLVGGDAKAMANITFDAGSLSIPDSQLPALNQLSQALTERPDLHLEITGTSVNQSDWPLVALQLVNQQLNKLWQQKINNSASTLNTTTIPEKVKNQLLLTLAKSREIAINKPLTAEQLQQHLIIHWPYNPMAMRKLAVERSKEVKYYLITEGNLSAERIYLLDAQVIDSETQQQASTKLELTAG